MTKNNGQNATIWTKWWKNATPESQIRMWDFYRVRQWILKFVPRYGKVLEAGCGLGRYVYYLSKFGIEIDGLDFTNSTINLLNSWKNKLILIAVFHSICY